MRSIIITAGGIGQRMGSSSPKQFLELNGKPILMHTLERFYAYNPNFQLIVTLPDAHISTWETLCQTHNFQLEHLLVPGGKERFHSVQNALKHCEFETIGIHDGVRPFVSFETLTRIEAALKDELAVIPVLEPKESLRQIIPDGSIALVRSSIRLVQTPQFFDKGILLKAYEQPFSNDFTDDASVVERMGIRITLVNGNPENIKITEPLDLIFAELLLNN